MNAIDTALLVNPHRIRDSIRRLFDGTPARIIGELLQNAQRAAASSVTIKTNPSGFSYEDDGHGLEGVKGFYKLLCLGDSNFSFQVEKDQSPMGLGFASLLASEQVESVKIQSGKLSLSIDCQRWWHDIDYYSSWANRLEEGNCVSGFKVEVRCHPEFTDSLRYCLSSKASTSWIWERQIQYYPALGYQDLLKVELDGQDVYTGLPYGFQEDELVTQFDWSGAKVKVYNPTDSILRKRQIINWYGQLILAPMEMPFSFLVVVRSGSPLTPKAPVRDSLVQNEAMANLQRAIADAVFQELCSLNSSKITTHNINALYSLDFERAGRECPYFLASAYLSFEPGQTSDEIDCTELSQVYRYDNPPVLIDSELKIIFSDNPEIKISGYKYGLSSFVDCLKASGITPSSPNAGASNRLRLNLQDLYWKPGNPKTEANKRTHTKWFYGRGWWAIGQGEEIDTLSWAEVTSDVFAFNKSSSWLDEVDWVIGTSSDIPIGTLQEFYMAGFDLDDYIDYDPRVSEYEDSLDGKVRLLLDDAVARNSDYATLLDYASRKTGQPKNRITHFKAEFNTEGEYGLLTSITLLGQTPLGEFKLTATIYG